MSNYPEKIDVAWPDPGYVSGHFAHSMASTIADMEYHACIGKVYRISTALPAYGRNLLVEEFMQGDSEWLWMVDSDMVFDKGHPMKLWTTAQEHDAKMVSGLAFMFMDGAHPVPSYFMEQDDGELYLQYNVLPNQPVEVAATGLASCLVHRSVFGKMEAPRHPSYRWFDQIVLPGNKGLTGEDTQFFVRARKLGFKLILDPDAETWHVKNIGIGKQDFVKYWELNGNVHEEE